ncbi:hypothetical protein LQR30_15140 [Chromobacterium piscinae]|nr:formyltransferase family protein [Chromobacterium piscinae]MCD4505431.1 hypothetical protein [Chromobacterium piscinae]
MRFAITLSDRFKPVLDVFLQAGWQPVKVFCTPVDHRMHHNKMSVGFAEQHKLPLQLSPMRPRDLEELAELGCETLLVGSYNWRIPDWTPYLKYAINFHPSLLPMGRGPYPQVRALLEGHREWGCSCHKVSPEFDAGDILAQERFALGEGDSHQMLDIKLQLALHRLSHKLAMISSACGAGRGPKGRAAAIGRCGPTATECWISAAPRRSCCVRCVPSAISSARRSSITLRSSFIALRVGWSRMALRRVA